MDDSNFIGLSLRRTRKVLLIVVHSLLPNRSDEMPCTAYVNRKKITGKGALIQLKMLRFRKTSTRNYIVSTGKDEQEMMHMYFEGDLRSDRDYLLDTAPHIIYKGSK